MAMIGTGEVERFTKTDRRGGKGAQWPKAKPWQKKAKKPAEGGNGHTTAKMAQKPKPANGTRSFVTEAGARALLAEFEIAGDKLVIVEPGKGHKATRFQTARREEDGTYTVTSTHFHVLGSDQWGDWKWRNGERCRSRQGLIWQAAVAVCVEHTFTSSRRKDEELTPNGKSIRQVVIWRDAPLGFVRLALRRLLAP